MYNIKHSRKHDAISMICKRIASDRSILGVVEDTDEITKKMKTAISVQRKNMYKEIKASDGNKCNTASDCDPHFPQFYFKPKPYITLLRLHAKILGLDVAATAACSKCDTVQPNSAAVVMEGVLMRCCGHSATVGFLILSMAKQCVAMSEILYCTSL